mmetsp:Transcript_7449/g.33641  ORF Transcript_7449/g.33641 Transcript_7449/m.33641 type:complete len:359 (-) Transcript_7449:1222-2298(-)
MPIFCLMRMIILKSSTRSEQVAHVYFLTHRVREPLVVLVDHGWHPPFLLFQPLGPIVPGLLLLPNTPHGHGQALGRSLLVLLRPAHAALLELRLLLALRGRGPRPVHGALGPANLLHANFVLQHRLDRGGEDSAGHAPEGFLTPRALLKLRILFVPLLPPLRARAREDVASHVGPEVHDAIHRRVEDHRHLRAAEGSERNTTLGRRRVSQRVRYHRGDGVTHQPRLLGLEEVGGDGPNLWGDGGEEVGHRLAEGHIGRPGQELAGSRPPAEHRLVLDRLPVHLAQLRPLEVRRGRGVADARVHAHRGGGYVRLQVKVPLLEPGADEDVGVDHRVESPGGLDHGRVAEPQVVDVLEQPA